MTRIERISLETRLIEKGIRWICEICVREKQICVICVICVTEKKAVSKCMTQPIDCSLQRIRQISELLRSHLDWHLRDSSNLSNSL